MAANVKKEKPEPFWKQVLRSEIDAATSEFAGEVTNQHKDLGGLPWNLVNETGSKIKQRLGLD